MGILSNIMDRITREPTSTDVLELLTAQHAEMDRLFEALAKDEGDRSALFVELADILAAHATAEEKIFYPAIMADETNDMLHESVEEHLSIKRILADLIGTRTDDEAFTAKLKVLEEQVAHHAHEEEEKKLFPKVRAMFDADQRAAIGNEYLVKYEILMTSHPYRSVPDDIDEAATLPTIRR